MEGSSLLAADESQTGTSSECQHMKNLALSLLMQPAIASNYNTIIISVVIIASNSLAFREDPVLVCKYWLLGMPQGHLYRLVLTWSACCIWRDASLSKVLHGPYSFVLHCTCTSLLIVCTPPSLLLF